ncbi:hypothetical protein LGM90_21120 [Burkholderia sp. AU28942]|uniref:hypothetical protein n=1 Tax=Burkholderia sp. AU28942 TaxID=2879626 RepID=UPI001CF0F262|nr:hypothetical protein [Burkholderia sp. AU28942]MCA8311014.1 hypothetical protein [Burkholderia sp. AU28942]
MKQTTVEKNRSRAHGREWFAASHFYVWLGAAAIIYFSDQLDRLFGLWILLVPLMAIPVLVAISIFVGGFIAILLARRWRRLFSVFTAPLMAIGLLMAARQFGINPDWIRFQVMRAHYSDLARNLPGPSPRYGEWSWGGTGGRPERTSSIPWSMTKRTSLSSELRSRDAKGQNFLHARMVITSFW